jgi:SAM-dependent methyltransferase
MKRNQSPVPLVNSIRHFGHDNAYDRFFAKMVDGVFGKAAMEGNSQEGVTREEKRSQHSVESDGGYKCIHLNINQFIDAFNNLISMRKWTPKQIEKMKFIDVGCGAGQKVFLAQCFGFRAFGLELRKALITEGKKAFDIVGGQTSQYTYPNGGGQWGKEEKTFIQGNALTFEGYADFDIIYFYCPLFKADLQAKLEDRIARTAKTGAIVVPFLSHGVFRTQRSNDGQPEPLHEAKELGWEFVSKGRNDDGQSYNCGYYIRTSGTYEI